MAQPDRTDESGRSPLAVGLAWSSRITTIALEMALPPLLGWWLDTKLGTTPLLVILLSILGFASAMFHLIALARSLSPSKPETGSITEGDDS
ncbi:AtpZ/AtpI family protein [Stratiformator vulcanicus]|uniref:F0F1-ATPase subunit (ATPase_gene1) n=1 Tax=Stratiformator vulcanicus TaxID=2527980 RepID=A0A517R1E2_9PLAN|nr:AtpZ/AtpI family protein [Stratiformator vulcanicus]QDT37725.1 Putative F0F1-ATPase subunit (ATPase_gene1) [Stratiformator vulcanicus]